MLMLLVYNDESDILKGCKDCRASTDDQVHVPALNSRISIEALALGKG